MIRCAGCGRPLGEDGQETAVASMSAQIMGDEYTECYYHCASCGQYTLTGVRDRFCGEESNYVPGTCLSQEEGEARIRLIKRCRRPWDKKCHCAAHVEYWGREPD